MFTYYSRIPAAALRRQHDGHLYAWIAERIDPHVPGAAVRIVQDYDNPRMVRADDALIRNGEAWVPFARVGNYIAQKTNLPHGVSFEQTPD